MLKVLQNITQSTGSLSAGANGAAVSSARAKTLSFQCNITASSPTGASVQLQKSNDGTNWANDGSAVSVTATGQYWLEKVDPTALNYRVAYAITGGSMSSTTTIVVQGHIS